MVRGLKRIAVTEEDGCAQTTPSTEHAAAAPQPHILGTVAYVIFARGARALAFQPVRAESDVDLTLLSPTAHCGRQDPSSPPMHLCAVAAPPAQYGPSQWIVWQDETLSKQLTHGQANSVRDGWVRACRAAKPHEQKLIRSCRKFGIL